ncbi:MAG TPA: hypothetical protein PKY59_05890 [Pyrinomonadaceae bacterium]|nr:hypothetical protein [Pyrinomonadaceae bacterium]
MKKFIFLTLFSIFALSISAFAQENRYGSTRLNNYADDLKRATVDLADRTSERLRNGYSVSRSDIEEAFTAAQLDASAGLFQDLVRGNNNSNNLRDAASLLSELIRKAPSYGSNNNLWRNARTAVDNINREIGNGGGYGGGGGYDNDNSPIVGRAYWRGTVDDRVQLVLQDRNLRVDTVSGRPYTDNNHSFTASLGRDVIVEVTKQKGRGDVRVVQQPSKQNDYVAIIEIADTDGGAKEYQLEIFWRRRR